MAALKQLIPNDPERVNAVLKSGVNIVIAVDGSEQYNENILTGVKCNKKLTSRIKYINNKKL